MAQNGSLVTVRSKSEEETSYDSNDNHEMVHGGYQLNNPVVVLGSTCTSSASSIGDTIEYIPVTTPTTRLKQVILSAVHIVYPALIILSGLSACGKTEFLRNLFRKNILKDKPLSSYFSQYPIVSGGFMSPSSRTVSAVVQTVFEYSFISGLYHYCTMEGLVPKYDDNLPHQEGRIFHCQLLQQTLTRLCNRIKELNTNQDSRPHKLISLEKKLYKGIAEISLWDLTVNRTSLRFLECFRGHLYNSHVWLFVDLEQDIDKLHLRPDPTTNDHPYAMQWRSRLHYLMRSSCLSESFHSKRSNVCRIFAVHSTPDSPALKEMLRKLQEEAENAALQYGLSHLFNFEIVPIMKNSEYAEREAYKIFTEYVDHFQVNEVPLSWTFLRFALEVSQNDFMKRDEIHKIANELNIDDINGFLKHYTSFGSLLDMKLVDDSSQWVILKPANFLENVCRLLSMSNAEYGIITPSMVTNIFGDHSETYFSILSSVHLVSIVPRCRLSNELSSKYVNTDFVYYMSVIRQGKPDKQSLPRAIQMVIDVKSPSMIMQIPFTNHLLQSLPSAVLASCKAVNVTIIQIVNGVEIEVVFQADIIEIRFNNPKDISIFSDVCSKVVKAIQLIAALRAKRGGKFSYYLRTQCVEEASESSNSVITGKTYHMLTDHLLCSKCSKQLESGWNIHQYFKIALEKVICQDEFYKAISNISADDALSLAQEIHEASDGDLLADVLSVPTSTSAIIPTDDDAVWLTAFNTVMSWRAVSRDKSKRCLVLQLLQAADGDSLRTDQEQKLLRKLARNLDIQAYSKAMQKLYEKKHAAIQATDGKPNEK